MILQLREFEPGLVAYLDPEILLEYGATCPQSVQGIHPFVCLDVSDDSSVWGVLSSSSLHGKRSMIDRKWKRGHTDSWLERDTYVYGANFWYAGALYAFQEASRLAEKSRTDFRNSVTPQGLQFIKARVHWSVLPRDDAA